MQIFEKNQQWVRLAREQVVEDRCQFLHYLGQNRVAVRGATEVLGAEAAGELLRQEIPKAGHHVDELCGLFLVRQACGHDQPADHSVPQHERHGFGRGSAAGDRRPLDQRQGTQLVEETALPDAALAADQNHVAQAFERFPKAPRKSVELWLPTNELGCLKKTVAVFPSFGFRKTQRRFQILCRLRCLVVPELGIANQHPPQNPTKARFQIVGDVDVGAKASKDLGDTSARQRMLPCKQLVRHQADGIDVRGLRSLATLQAFWGQI